jgi:hypothetical protein
MRGFAPQEGREVQQVQQLQRVQQDNAVAVVEGEVQQGPYVIGPVAHHPATLPRIAPSKKAGCCTSTRAGGRQPSKRASAWPPVALTLPSLATLERLSRPGGGPVVQQPLFPLVPDDGKAARLRRLVGTVPGVATADSLPPRSKVLPSCFPRRPSPGHRPQTSHSP